MGRELDIFTLFASHPFSLQAKGASLAFIRGSSKLEDGVTDGRSVQLLLAYLNVDHEYVLFDPLDSHTHIHKISRGNLADLEETGLSHFLYLSSCLTHSFYVFQFLVSINRGMYVGPFWFILCDRVLQNTLDFKNFIMGATSLKMTRAQRHKDVWLLHEVNNYTSLPNKLD